MHSDKEQENYAREILQEQQEQGWEGLSSEGAEICRVAGLPNACLKYLSRAEVEDALRVHHLKEIRMEMEPLKKMDDIKNKDTRYMQEYMQQKSLENSRTEFLWETHMMDNRCNMKGKYKKGKYQCPHCKEGSLETSGHLLVCLAYADLREELDPELRLEDRASYLRKVVIRRTLLEQQLKSRRVVLDK
jgi:hypothetical protein